MQLQLTTESGVPAGPRLNSGDVFRIGRSLDSQLRVNDPSVSSVHCELRCGKMECRIRDCGSSNGTFVNGERLISAQLHEGDIIRVGETSFLVSVHHGECRDNMATDSMDETEVFHTRHNSTTPESGILHRGGMFFEVRSGIKTGLKVSLLHGQVIQVGRTEDADCAIPDDKELAPIHMAIECGDVGCLLIDGGSCNGTLLNGQQVVKASLCEGDVITAGNTTLVVSIPGATDSTRLFFELKSDEAEDVRLSLPYDQDTANSGVSVFHCCSVNPLDVFDRMSSVFSVAALIDFKRLNRDPSTLNAEPRYLIDWISDDGMKEFSPVVVLPSDTDDFRDIIEEGWGSDGLVVFFSRLDPDSLVSKLRDNTRDRPPNAAPGDPDGALPYYWPSVGRMLLEHCPPEQAISFFDGIAAALFEVADPESCDILGFSKLAETLIQLGFRKTLEQDAEEALSQSLSESATCQSHPNGHPNGLPNG